MKYLLDTNVISELMKEQPAEPVFAWAAAHKIHCHVSAITIGEIEQGLELLPDGARKLRLNTAYREFLDAVNDRLVPFDVETARCWSKLIARRQKLGRRLPTLDSMIEATALSRNLTLVTRNTADFAEAVTVNPWLD